MKKLNRSDFQYNDEYVKAKKSMRNRVKQSRINRSKRTVYLSVATQADTQIDYLVDNEMMYYAAR